MGGSLTWVGKVGFTTFVGELNIFSAGSTSELSCLDYFFIAGPFLYLSKATIFPCTGLSFPRKQEKAPLCVGMLCLG